MPNRIGQQLGNYRLIRLLGSGGFAEVYLGEHIYLGTQAAIKVLQTQLTTQEVQQFHNEARTIARLIHPNIVRILEFGVEGNTPFLVMDYAPHGTLRDRHPKGNILPLDIVITYARQIADALQYAHDSKLIHRDIKPENMLVGQHNQILLSDFGIAVVAHSTRSQKTEDVIGTVDYMAPEQIQAHPSIASDQYALGIVVYEWLCGAPPFNGTRPEVAIKHLSVPPSPLRTRVPTIPPLIEEVVLKALEKDSSKRFARVQAFATALGHASGLHSALATPSMPNQQQFHVAPTISPTSQVPAYTMPPLSPPMVNTPGTASIGTLLCNYRGHSDHVHSIAWSPDRKRIASAGVDAVIRVWDASTGEEFATFTHPGYVVNAVAWSPDGKYIASGGADGTVQLWNMEEGKLLGCAGSYGYSINALAWSPDGRHIASGVAGGDATVQVCFVSIQNDLYTHIYNGPKNLTSVTSVAWSPDGKYIAFACVDGMTYAGYVKIESTQYDFYNAIVTCTSAYRGHTDWVNVVWWSSDSRRIVTGGEDKTVQIWDAATGSTILTYTGHTDTVRAVAWSSDRKRIASAGDDKVVKVWDAVTGNDIFTYQGHSDTVRAVAWSPDRKRIASAGEDNTVQVWTAL